MKMWSLKTFIVPVIVKAMGIIKKGIDTYIKTYLLVPAYMKYKKLLLTEMHISLLSL